MGFILYRDHGHHPFIQPGWVSLIPLENSRQPGDSGSDRSNHTQFFENALEAATVLSASRRSLILPFCAISTPA
jgi:hypothetical protein